MASRARVRVSTAIRAMLAAVRTAGTQAPPPGARRRGLAVAVAAVSAVAACGTGGPPSGPGEQAAGPASTSTSTVESSSEPSSGLRVGFRALGVDDASLRKSRQVKTSHDGQVIEGLDATQIVVRHRRVVIRGNRVGSRGSTVDAIVIRGGDLGTLIEFNELMGSDQPGVVSGNGILGYDGAWTARHNDIHHVTDGAKVGSDVVFEENYVHDVRRVGDTHNDGLQIDKGRGIVIRGNRIELTTAGNAAVWINNMEGPVEDVVVEDNWLRAPGFVLKVADKRQGHPRPVGVVWRDNVLYRDRDTRPHPTPRWGPWGGNARLAAKSGNRWSDTGELVKDQG